MKPMLRLATVTFYDQDAWLVKIGLMSGHLTYENLNCLGYPSTSRIKEAVAKHFRISASEMTSDRRGREVARPRQVAMYLSRHLTPRTLPEIGRRFGGRDHTTVLHGIRQIEKLMLVDSDLARSVQALTKELQG